MIIAQVNAYANGSTGSIMTQIADYARRHGHKVQTFSAAVFSVKGKARQESIPDHSLFSGYRENFIHYTLAQCTDGNGLYSVFGTIRLVRRLKEIRPDILHLHNIHEFCLCFPILFRYIRKNRINTVWTFHDCWAFTGHCMHFDYAGCESWKTGCGNCPRKHFNPRSRIDRSSRLWKIKRKVFTSTDTLTIVTPSDWLAGLVKESFLGNCTVRVIRNGIDLKTFALRQSDFREKKGFGDHSVVLGVASDWCEMKGLDIFIRLARDLGEDFRIVLVGTNERLEKSLPDNIYCIRRTADRKELADIYSAADVFANPTREDTFPTVNIEALACGTPVVTFRTGGSPEIPDGTCGSVVERDDYEAFRDEITRICREKPFSQEDCIRRAGHFSTEACCEEYLTLYESICGK